ncbi:unnamed protein product [Dibothriocephalus latus]|uniref:CSC1/OSCA1-like 7TM region domain-containing protein n=1 Tax=Dibothriocephalus latus TaxID=60516 RepID=A0A3P7P6T9_DIBLA|nr:unnamed protein product [Dibothriocephalus latus]
MPNNGSFFVNYVITATFIGSACDLARMSELTMYAIRLLFLRSKSEKIAAQKAVLVEFDFGINYAWLVCAFAVITSYSILCPLITPFGFVCLCMRYAVARYNLFFAYMPSRIDMRMHWLATSLMLGCVLMLQLNIFIITWFLFGVFAGWIYVDGKAVKRRFSFHPPTLDRRWPEPPAMPPRPHLEPSPSTQPPPVTLEAPSPNFEPRTPRHFRFSTGLVCARCFLSAVKVNQVVYRYTQCFISYRVLFSAETLTAHRK